MNDVFSFDDVLLVPQKSEILTRDDVDIGLIYKNIHFFVEK